MTPTPAELRLQRWAKIWAPLYALAGLGFALLGPQLLASINFTSARLMPSLPLIPEDAGRFWLALAVSMMATIAACSALGARDAIAGKDYALAVATAKITSTTLGVAFFARDRHLADLVVAFTDFPLFVANVALWRAAARSRPQAA